jgi:hypothetical protein
MSAASVRTSGRRDNFPVLPKAAGNKGEPGSFSKPVALKVLVEELSQFVVDGEFLLFAALFFKPQQKPFSGRIIVFNFEVHDGADPGERVGKSA